VGDVDTLGALYGECRENDLKIGAYPFGEDPSMFGPAWHNYHEKLKAIKELLDPNNVSNPPQPVGRVSGGV
jgi:hypothetical protein